LAIVIEAIIVHDKIKLGSFIKKA